MLSSRRLVRSRIRASRACDMGSNPVGSTQNNFYRLKKTITEMAITNMCSPVHKGQIEFRTNNSVKIKNDTKDKPITHQRNIINREFLAIADGRKGSFPCNAINKTIANHAKPKTPRGIPKISE